MSRGRKRCIKHNSMAVQAIVNLTVLFGCLSSSCISCKVHSFDMPAYRICKPGPKLDETAKTAKRCLVIGDSISIGYTLWVQKLLEEKCEVLHAPWDTIDGGALDSKYGLECLSLFLVSAMLEPISYDVIIFNFGMHDVNYIDQFPEEYVPSADYSLNLELVKHRLLTTGAKVGFVLTTPAPWNATINELVKIYNALAVDVMRHGPAVPVADLYTWVVQVCGEPPYNSCSIADKQPSPHYTVGGYKYLAMLVSAFITDLLDESHDRNDISQLIEVLFGHQDSSHDCKNEAGEVVSVCPPDATCVKETFSGSLYGCCPLPNAVSCRDGKHCCPAGYRCDPECNQITCQCLFD